MLEKNSCIFAFIICLYLSSWMYLNYEFLHFVGVISDIFVSVNTDKLYQHTCIYYIGFSPNASYVYQVLMVLINFRLYYSHKDSLNSPWNTNISKTRSYINIRLFTIFLYFEILKKYLTFLGKSNVYYSNSLNDMWFKTKIKWSADFTVSKLVVVACI